MELTDKEQWQLRHGRPVPARITWALNSRGLEGPTVDEKCDTWEGNPAGDVDDWEAARATPRPEQVLALAKLTHYPVGWFYLPVQPGPQLGGVWISWRGRRGCEYVPADVVDERGVVLAPDAAEPADPRDVQIGLFPLGDVQADTGPRRRKTPVSSTPAAPGAGRRRRPRPEPSALMPRTRMPEALRTELVAKLDAERELRRAPERPG